jgi:hypothetical protein
MFRDQSGLAATIGLTQAALQGTQSGAAAAGQTASQNLQSQLQATTERQKTAANMITDLAKTAASVYTGGLSGALGGGGSSGQSGSSSQKGALINYFDKTQGGAGATPSGSSGAGGVNAVTGSGHSSGGTSASTGGAGGQTAGGSAGSSASLGFSQNPAALSAVGGNSDLSNLLVKASDMASSIVGSSSPVPTQSLSTRKAWPNLNPDEVLPRISALAQTPHLFQQGNLPLCVVGTFFYHMFVLKPSETAQFAKDLYGQGQALLGKFNVAPGDDLRNANYQSIFQKTDLKFVPPQADWMLMCSVRDSENWWFDYEGDPSETIAIFTAARDINDWYNKTGFFSSVKWDPYNLTDPSVATLKALNKTNTNGIALWIKTKMLRSIYQISESWIPSKHTLALTSTPVIDEANNSIKFEFWTWGTPPRMLEEKLDFVRDCIMGITVVTL